MGYTMVTSDGKRITQWLSMQYNNATGAFLPQWETTSVVRPSWVNESPSPLNASVVPNCPVTAVLEYYDHSVDPEENYNLALAPTPTRAAEIAALLKRLRAGWRAALTPA
jgi:hypothetical protein